MIDLNEFVDWAVGAKTGDNIEYYRGFLAEDRDASRSKLSTVNRTQLNQVASRAMNWSDAGTVVLVQRRNGFADYSYLAVRCDAPYQA